MKLCDIALCVAQKQHFADAGAPAKDQLCATDRACPINMLAAQRDTATSALNGRADTGVNALDERFIVTAIAWYPC